MNHELDQRQESVQGGLIQKLIGAVEMTSHYIIFLQPRYVT